MKFLGYDPGGRGAHGVAAIHVSPDGEIASNPAPICEVVENAGLAWEWLSGHDDASALGIDTLMAWSLTGIRQCDIALRKRYPKRFRSVIHQNALYSAMTLNGALVAKRAAKSGWRLFESHPKLLVNVLPSDDSAANSVLKWYSSVKAQTNGTIKGDKRADDMADAVVAAWSAAQGFIGRWQVDLFNICGDQLERIEKGATYPWYDDIIN